MRRLAFHLGGFFAGLSLVVSVLAQQGHPLTGTWSGDWGQTSAQRTQVTMVMNWDGKDIKCTMDPGPDAVPCNVVLDVINWNVRIEADPKDKSGKATHVTADGKIDDLGSYHRTISGTWKQGATNGTFKLTRD
jgi:hypothetical protein